MHVSALRRGLAVVALVLLWGCSRPAATTTPAAAPGPHDDVARLVLPVPRDAAARQAILDALARLRAHADTDRTTAGDAGWARAHYLLDLLDDARFRRDPRSLDLLHGALGTAAGAPRQGPAATDAALQAIAVALDQVLARDRLHPGAQAARVLVAYDLEPPRERAAVHARMEPVEAVARGGGAVADNARLRLHGYCRQALADAARARPAHRSRVLAHCLFPLYEADPAAYFADDPAARPPPPDWRALAGESGGLLAAVAESPGRLSVTGRALREELRALVASLAPALPALPDPVALGLARVDHARLYDFTPLLVLDPALAGQVSGAVLVAPGAGSGRAGHADGDHAPVDALARAVAADGRGAVTAVLPAVAPAAQALDAAELAAGAGAERLALLAWIEQSLEPRAGDYWSRRVPPGGRVRRLAALPLSLAALAPPAGTRDRAGSGPARAAAERPGLTLHLVVDRETWQLTSPDGALAPIPTSSEGRDPAEALGAQLARIHSAFATPPALLLVPGREATIGALLAAAAAAARDADGRRRPGRMGLARAAPAPRGDTLARRIERRAGAVVDIAPGVLQARAPIVRACYQDVLDQRPRAAGAVRLERRGGDIVATAGPADRDLRACVQSALAPGMRARDIPSATATLRPRAP